MNNLNNIVFDYLVIMDKGDFTDASIKDIPKEIAINFNKGDIIENDDKEIFCVSHKRYVNKDENGFRVLEIYLEIV